MSCGYNALVVVMREDLDADQAESLKAAIRLLAVVASVEANVCDVMSHIAETRARARLLEQIRSVLANGKEKRDA